MVGDAQVQRLWVHVYEPASIGVGLFGPAPVRLGVGKPRSACCSLLARRKLAACRTLQEIDNCGHARAGDILFDDGRTVAGAEATRCHAV